MDTDKKIIELSERLSTDEESKESSKLKENLKSIVEMNNERYLVVTLKNQRNKIGVCILQDFNTVNQADLYSKYSIGDDIDTQLLKESGKEESKFLLLMPKQTQKAVKAVGKFSLEEGSLVTGTLKSIKGHCAFI